MKIAYFIHRLLPSLFQFLFDVSQFGPILFDFTLDAIFLYFLGYKLNALIFFDTKGRVMKCPLLVFWHAEGLKVSPIHNVCCIIVSPN